MGRRCSLQRDMTFAMAVKSSRSVAEVLRILKLRVGGANYFAVHRAIRDMKLDTSHWTGMGHRKGSRIPVVPAQPLEKILVRDSAFNSICASCVRIAMR